MTRLAHQNETVDFQDPSLLASWHLKLELISIISSQRDFDLDPTHCQTRNILSTRRTLPWSWLSALRKDVMNGSRKKGSSKGSFRIDDALRSWLKNGSRLKKVEPKSSPKKFLKRSIGSSIVKRWFGLRLAWKLGPLSGEAKLTRLPGADRISSSYSRRLASSERTWYASEISLNFRSALEYA